MDPAKKKHLHEELARKFRRANSSKLGCFILSSRDRHRGDMKTLDTLGDETDAHKPGVWQLNLKPSLMGVQIYDGSEHFFSRQSSAASLVSERFRLGVDIPCFSGRQQGDELEVKRGRSKVASSDSGRGTQSRTHLGDSTWGRPGRRARTTTFEEARAASGVLYPPSPQDGENANSSILNAVHFTFGDVGATGSDSETDKIYMQLLEQARSHKCSQDASLEMTNTTSHTTHRSSSSVAKQSFGSTGVGFSASLTFSERLFGYEFSRDSFRRQSQLQPDAKSDPASLTRTAVPPQLNFGRQCSSNATSSSSESDYEDTDDDDIIIAGDSIFEMPREASFRCSHYQQQYAELVMVRARPRRKSARWSSNKNSFYLNLKQQSVDTNDRQPQQQRQSTAPEPESRTVKAREKLDVSHRDMSSRLSFDGGSHRLKQQSLFPSESSLWLGSESDSDDFVLDSGRLKIDVPYGPDMDKPFSTPQDRQVPPRGGPKLDEADFPSHSPVASSFLFKEPNGEKRSEEDAPPLPSSMTRATMVLELADFDGGDFDLSDDAFYDPEDASLSDTDSSLTAFSMEGDTRRCSSSFSLQGGPLDLEHLRQPPPTQWISRRSFNYLREVVDHNSGFLNIESRSGRFSVDLRQEKWLGKVEHPPSISISSTRPARVRRVVSFRRAVAQSSKPASSSKRSLLAPCLVCLSCIHQRPAHAEQP